MSTSRKWSRSMIASAVVFAVCVFLLLALVSFQKQHYDNPEAFEDLPTFFSGVSEALFGSLGGSAYFLVTIALAWSIIIFFRERSREILPRAGGLAVLVCAAATLFALWGNDYLGGRLGAGIGGLLGSFPGPVVSSILVSVVFVVSFIVATDWLFYSALREAVAGPDIATDEKPPVALPTPYDEEQVIASEEELEAEPEEEEEAAEEEPEEPAEESPATVAAVPEGLRKVLGHGSRDIEVEETGVELAEDGSEDTDEAPVVTVVEAAEAEPEVEDEIRMPVGQLGHEIAVHQPDVEFVDEEEPIGVAAPMMPPPGLFDAGEVIVEEEIAVPQEDAAESPEVVETEPEAEAPEEAPVEEAPEPEPDSPFAGVVLEDEVVEWGATEEEPEPVPEDEPTDIADPEPEPEQEPEPEAPPEAPVDEPDPAEPDKSPADEKFDSVLESLLGPVPQVEGAVAEAETATAVATEEPEEEPVPDVEPETDLPAPEEPVAKVVDENPQPETETEPEESVAEEEETDEPELEPEVDAPPDAAEEAVEAPPTEAPARGGLVGWFRKNKTDRTETETDSTASAAPPKRTRRRVSETPDLFDPEPTDRPVEPGAELIDEAALLVIEMGRASVVLIQRRLGIGYNRARTLVERLVAEGVLGPMGETGSHPVLLTEDAWKEKRSPVA